LKLKYKMDSPGNSLISNEQKDELCSNIPQQMYNNQIGKRVMADEGTGF